MPQAAKITVLNKAERLYYLYRKSKEVAELLEWFKAELALEPTGFKNHVNYTDEYLQLHTRHVEILARDWRKNRK